jgi:transcriptional regulator with XRE-family HTH domain
MTPFGAQLRRLRAKRRVPLKHLAAAIEVSSAYLSALEHGHRGVPSTMLLHQVTDALALTWEEADELEHLARLSHPRVVVDTAGLAPDRTAFANHLARTIHALPEETIAKLQAVLDAATTPPVIETAQKSADIWR